MNAERLYAIALSIQRDLEELKITDVFQQLVNALANQVSQPGQPQYQQETSRCLNELYITLGKSEVNSFSPAWRQVLVEIGGDYLLGDNLAARVRDIFNQNQITPAVAHSTLQSVFSELAEFSGAIDRLVASLHVLGIECEDLEPSESEIGVLIPRAFVDNELGDFANELKEINRIFSVFSEISTGSRPGFKIKTISSSELTVFLEAAPVVAACIAHGVERVVELYKKLLEIRKLQAELSKQGVAKKDLKGVEDHAKSVMEKGIELVIKELMREFKSTVEPGRKNELTTELRLALNKLSNRVDCGFNFEVRMQAPDQIEDDNQKEDQAMQELERKCYDDISSAAKNLQFLKLEGDPILHLPEEVQGSSCEDSPKI
jgi:hypothetical protein